MLGFFFTHFRVYVFRGLARFRLHILRLLAVFRDQLAAILVRRPALVLVTVAGLLQAGSLVGHVASIRRLGEILRLRHWRLLGMRLLRLRLWGLIGMRRYIVFGRLLIGAVLGGRLLVPALLPDNGDGVILVAAVTVAAPVIGGLVGAAANPVVMVAAAVLRCAGDRRALLLYELLPLLLLSLVDVVVERISVLLDGKFLVIVHRDFDYVPADGFILRTDEVFHIGVHKRLLHGQPVPRVEYEQFLDEIDALFPAVLKELMEPPFLGHVYRVQDAPAQLRFDSLDVLRLWLAE